MKILTTINFLFLFQLILLSTVGAHSKERTDNITRLHLKGVVIEIQDVSSGDFTIPGTQTIAHLPSFIRVKVTSKPTTESNIRIEIWLPKKNWNGRYLGTGNGGGAGNIAYNPLIAGIRRGFAVANTDMGTSPGVYNILNQPEKWADFGYRATHEMTKIAKEVIKAYYGKTPDYSYFSGCSTGGQQALMEAQRFPDDYNGIIAGGPANNRTHLHASFIWNTIAVNPKGTQVLTSKKLELFSKILLKNQRNEGGYPGDNFMTDPGTFNFDTELLKHCAGAMEDSCFNENELTALNKIYSGPINPRTGERIYAPLPLGGTSLDSTIPHLYPFFWVFGKDFDYTKFDFDRDMTKVDSILGPILNANNPDLNPMKKRGGKILMYTGTADQLVPYPDALYYYQRVIKDQGGLKQTQEFFRYFLVPGMGHCAGGPGANDFGQGLGLNSKPDADHDLLTALMNWVEKGIAPDSIIATNFNCCDTLNRINFQRPVYPWPKFPEYTGGNPNLPSSYRGVAHLKETLYFPDKTYLKY